MMRLRIVLHALWLNGVTVMAVLLLIPALALPRGVNRAGIRLWAWLQLWGMRRVGGVTVQIRGRERLPAGPVMVAGKHQSMFDIVPPFVYLSDPAFVLKKELTAIPIFGWHCLKARMVPVDREAHAKALKDLVTQAVDRLKAGRQLIIFPEGTRKTPGEAPDYKPGVAALYRELAIPCVPVATNAGAFLTSSGLVRRRGVVVYEILEAIPPGLKRGEFMRRLESQLETASAAL